MKSKRRAISLIVAMLLAVVAGVATVSFVGCDGSDNSSGNNNSIENPNNNSGNSNNSGNNNSIENPNDNSSNSNNEVEEHKHSYTLKVESAAYLKTAGNCKKKGVYYYSCKCGEKGTETFTSENFGEHKYSDGIICDICDEVNPDAVSEGLEYKLLGSNYVVSGIGTCTDKDIIIAPKYNSKQVVGIGERAFANNTKIKSVYLPEGIKTIEEKAFLKCSSLKSVEFSPDLETIGQSAFEDCYFLEKVIMPQTVTTLGQKAFLNCSSLETLILSSGLEKILYATFESCVSLKSVVIPDNLKEIGPFAFSDCVNLKSVSVNNVWMIYSSYGATTPTKKAALNAVDFAYQLTTSEKVNVFKVR